jgi:hypothetical protein
LEITPETAENIFVQLSQAKVSNIQEVVLQAGKTKYKNKKENPAYAIMQKVWAQKRNNGLDKFDTYSFKEYEKTQFDLNNLDSAFMKKRSSISWISFSAMQILQPAEDWDFLSS